MGKASRRKKEAKAGILCKLFRHDQEPLETTDLETTGVSPGMIAKAEGMTRKVVEKILAPKWAKMNLAGQVKVARKMMKVAGMANFRRNFLENFPSDLADKRKKGATDDQIVEYYMGCPEFVEFWKDLSMGEEHIRSLLEDLA